LSNSHFALVFDISSFKESNFKTKSEIEGERKELKSGSVLTVKDSDIKKANINRYMQEIAKRSDIVSDISNLPKVIKRLVGGENILFFMLYNSRFTNNLDSLADYYVSALTNDSYKERLSEFISSKYKSISETNLYTSNNIKSLKLYCQQKELEGEYKIIDGLERLSKKLFEKISVMKFECVEDIDILKAKLDSIRQVFRNSRYHLTHLDYVMDSISSKNFENPKKYLTEHYYVSERKTLIIQGIEQCIKVLDRY
jgi:ABC-type multidrug transport system fused ATPase/permease subunit